MENNSRENTRVEILIVEDSPTQAAELKYTLERHNFAITVACNGIEALAQINARMPSIVISDIVMPGMDGYQLCRKIKQDDRFKNLPVILLTSLSDPRDVVQGLECGADNFLTKPYEEKYIISRIQYILANKNLKDVERTQLGVEIVLDNERYFIKSDRIQILNLLLSSYDAAIQKNYALVKTQKELKTLNEQLEQMVESRTAALRESEGRYRLLLESVTDYVYTTLVENGRPVATSHGSGCVAVTGYTSGEYAADPGLWLRMVHEEDRPIVMEQANSVFAGKTPFTIEHRIIHKDGRVRWVRDTPVPRYNQEGSLIACDGIVTDITEQKILERQLFQSNKMEAIGQLAGGIAHDFNNILTAIIGFSTIIEMDMDEDDPNRVNVEHILVAAGRAADLTGSLLTFSRKQVINPQPVDLNQIIGKTEKFLQRIIGEDIDFKASICQDVLTVNADSGQIEQVLMNLATNARDAMPKGGLISLETGTVEMDEEYVKANGYGKPGSYAVISFSDTGEGMDETTCKKVFEPFFTTKEVGKGTGLGLSIVYGILKQHDGFINVYSEPGNGTTFKIYLPLIHAEVAVSPAGKEEILEGGTETILVADDDASLRELSEKFLVMFGYTIITAVDGLDALAKFRENRDKIDLVILDVIMPKMNGKDAFDEMRKINSDVKAIFISGYTGEIIHKRGILDQTLVFVSKPLNLRKLLIKVREVLGGSHQGSKAKMKSP
jgi:PAS domain S-box-containing protein